MRPSGNPAILEDRRIKAIKLFNSGHSQASIAKIFNVGQRTVRLWVSNFKKNGKSGLISRPNTGRPPKIDSKITKRLEAILIRGAKKAGFATDLWTCPRIAQVIKKKFGISYHVDHLCRLLRSLGWSPQKPEKRAIERDENKIRTWRRIQWPRIKKKPVS